VSSREFLYPFVDALYLFFEFFFIEFEVFLFLVFGEELTVSGCVITTSLWFAATVAHFISSWYIPCSRYVSNSRYSFVSI